MLLAKATTLPPLTPRAISIVLCSTLGTATYAFTWNSVTVALPHMQGTFSATTDQIAWVMISFIIGSSMMTTSVGWFSARFGRRTIYLWTVATYTVTLFGCGFSTTLEEEVLWRLLQGFSGAALIPLGQLIAVNAFPKERYSQATSLWAMGFVFAGVIAPALAGFVIEDLSWPWIFYVNVPISLAVFTAAWFLIPRSEQQEKPMDWLGYGSLLLSVGVLQLMLARGERLDWFQSREIIVEALIVVIAFYVFLAHTFTAKRSFVPLELFADRNFKLGLVFIFFTGTVLFLPLLLLPLQLKSVADYAAIDTGYLLLPRGIGTLIGLTSMAYLRDRVDPRPTLCVGLAITGLSAWYASDWSTDIRPWDVMWTSFLHGLATGAVWAPLNTLTLSRLPSRIQDQGFALFYLSFDVGYALGTAAVVGVHGRLVQINHAVISEVITPFNEILRYRLGSDAWDITKSTGLNALDNEVTRQSLMIAFNNTFLMMALLLFGMIPFIILFRRPAPMSSASD